MIKNNSKEFNLHYNWRLWHMVVLAILIILTFFIYIFVKTKKSTTTEEITEAAVAPVLRDTQTVVKRDYNKTNVQFDKMVEVKLSKNLEVEVQHNSVAAKFRFDRIFYDASQKQFVIKAYKYLDSEYSWSGRLSTLYSNKLGYIFYNGQEYDDIYELLKEISPDNTFFQKKSIKKNKSKISFEYINSEGTKSNRTVDVNDIYLSNGAYYLKGYCNLRNESRTFRIDKMVNISDLITGENFISYGDYLEKIKS